MNLPIIAPLSFVVNAIKALDVRLTIPQRKNMGIILTAMILLKTLCLSKICGAMVEQCAVNTLSHFFSYAGLCGYALMHGAVRYAIKIFDLARFSVKLAIDDTMKHHSKFCKCIDAVYWLFDHVIQANCKAQCIVFAYLVINETIRFPIGWRIYRQDGLSKWELALELVDEAISFGLKIEVVLFDSWFCVSGMISGLKERKIHFISEVKGSHIIEFWAKTEKRTRKFSFSISKLFDTFYSCLCKEVCLALKCVDSATKKEKCLYKTYETIAYIRAFKGKFKLVKSIDERTLACKIFITDELTWEAQKILVAYASRWLIEEFFKNAKGHYGLKGACIRSRQGGAILLFLVSFADLLFSIQLWRSVLANPEKGQPTVSAIIATAEEENLRNLIPILQDPLGVQKVIDAWLGALQREQQKMRKKRRELISMGSIDLAQEPNKSKPLKKVSHAA